FWGPPIFEHLL
ncbi:unnamed protein product, partial [Allacma fusca]